MFLNDKERKKVMKEMDQRAAHADFLGAGCHSRPVVDFVKVRDWKHSKIIRRGLLVLTTLGWISCEESLPTYQAPINVLGIEKIVAEQEYDPQQGINIKFEVIGRNFYEETLEDTLNVRGSIRIRWKREPAFQATLTLGNDHFIKTSVRDGMLRLDPLQDFVVTTRWWLKTDENLSFMDICAPDVATYDGEKIWSEPETFLFDVRLTVFDGSGDLPSREQTFELTVWEYWQPMFKLIKPIKELN
jgi:hypothetical protein